MNIDDMKLSKGEKSPCDGCKDRVDDEFGEFYCDIVCQKHTWWVTRQDGANAQLAKYLSFLNSELRELFSKYLTEDSETQDARRKEFNQAIFDRDKGYAVFNGTGLNMVMGKFDKALSLIIQEER